MNEPTILTRPQFYRAGQGAILESTADPSVTLIELGDEFGFLLSESADDAEIQSRLRLENVLWAKGVPARGAIRRLMGAEPELAHRSLDLVEVFRHETGVFVVQDPYSGEYLPQPSVDPYVVVFITPEQYGELRRGIEQDLFAGVADDLRLVLGGIPGFSMKGENLIGPETYARGVEVRPELPLMRL